MTILGLECTAKAASAAVFKDGTLLCETFTCVPLTHSQTLLPMVEDMLKNAKLTLGEMECIAVAAGPGSFTGLRIGIAAAKGMAFGLGIPCCGVSTLEAMAYGAAVVDGGILPVMDARCGQVYTASFLSTEKGLSRIVEDRAVSVDKLFQELAEQDADSVFYKKPVFLVGDGAQMCYNMGKEKLSQLRLCPPNLVMQRAAGVCLAAQEKIRRGELVAPADLLPVYLRLPQAERELLSKQNEGKNHK